MVVLVNATISTLLLVDQYSVQMTDWNTLLVFKLMLSPSVIVLDQEAIKGSSVVSLYKIYLEF